MGARGPAPKRSTQRRRRNSRKTDTAKGADQVETPKPLSHWHPVVKRWFESLAKSGQSVFYEPSDWAMAEMLAESMSRDLKPKVVGVSSEGEVFKEHLPISGQAMSSYLKGMTALLVSEVDRRRAGIELKRPQGGDDQDEEDGASVSELDEYRDRLSGGGTAG